MHAEKFELLEAKIRETALLVSRFARRNVNSSRARERATPPRRNQDAIRETSNSASVCMN